MSKFEACKEAYKNHVQEVEGLKNEIKELKAQAEQMEKEKEAAAVSGNLEAHQKATAKAEAVKQGLYVKETALSNKAFPISAEDAAEAWADYAGPVNEELQKKLNEYRKARTKLYSTLLKAVEVQNKANGIRKECITWAAETAEGIDVNSYKDAIVGFPELLELAEIEQDARFFLVTGICDQDEFNRILDIVDKNESIS